MTRTGLFVVMLLIAGAATAPRGQQSAPPSIPLPTEPRVFDSSSRGPGGAPIPGPKFRVVPLGGLSHPFSLTFLPDGGLLIAERAGKLRIVRHGVLDPEPISGLPPVLNRNLKGMTDIAVHPRFAENHWVYFTYYKPQADDPEAAAATLARGRYDGNHTLADVRDLLTTDTLVTGASVSRIVFGRDGKLYMSIGVPIPNRSKPGRATPKDAQDPASLFGKILRLNDDGSVPADNPFTGRAGYRPEIFALGLRNVVGLAVHPETGEIWATDNGPQGGDELNLIHAGLNYGWPLASYGRSYGGDLTGDSGPVSNQPVADGFESPVLFWSPSPSLAGLTFYTGDQFPAWKGSAFVGGLVGEQLQRIVFNLRGLPIRRDSLLRELRQRIADVREGPDGLLYVLTDENEGALLRIEPVAPSASSLNK